jgi:two-component system sensor kinase FixL
VDKSRAVREKQFCLIHASTVARRKKNADRFGNRCLTLTIIKREAEWLGRELGTVETSLPLWGCAMAKMNTPHNQHFAEQEVDKFRTALGPFVVAAEMTRMATVFTNALEPGHPIIFANDSFLRLTGYSREEVLGQPFVFMLASGEPKVLEQTARHFESGCDVLDIECRRKDGGFLWVALCANPVPDEHGAIVQHCVSLVDLSAQMKRIRRERNALHALYQHTPDFIAITEGADHRFTFANAAYQELVGPRDLLGRDLAHALPEVVGQQVVVDRDRAYATGDRSLGKAVPIRLQREVGADLELRYVDVIHQPIRDADGTVTGIFCEGHDVTEQREVAEQMHSLQAELIHLSRLSAMGTMAATLAHELTQPLTAIANHVAICSHLAGTQGEASEQIAESLAAITSSAQHGGEIIRRLRDMTMRRRPQRERFGLKAVAQESIALVRAGAGAGISIEDRTSAAIELIADRVQIQQVIINLVRNACESIGDDGGRVTLLSAIESDRVVISVKDSGPGVSDEASRTLFQWADSTKPEGTGIGLSICRTIVDAHGGELWLAESGPGGACFSFSLPLEVAASAPGAPLLP